MFIIVFRKTKLISHRATIYSHIPLRTCVSDEAQREQRSVIANKSSWKWGGVNLSGLLTTSSSGAMLPPCTHHPDSLNGPFSALSVGCLCMCVSECVSVQRKQGWMKDWRVSFQHKGTKTHMYCTLYMYIHNNQAHSHTKWHHCWYIRYVHFHK